MCTAPMAVEINANGHVNGDNGTGKAAPQRPKLVVGNAINSSTGEASATTSTTAAHASGEFQYAPLSTPYRVLQQYHSKPTKVRVVCVGAGAGGLCVSYKIGRMLEPGSWELTVYEKNSGVGGTWFENRYVGFHEVNA